MKKLSVGQNIILLKDIIDHAPFPLGVYTGWELKIALANKCMLDTWGKGNDVIGKTYTEILPELTDQAIFEQARNVLVTGIPFNAKNQPVDIVIEGALTRHYFNYSFTPLRDEEGLIYGVMNTGADVTDLYNARKKAEDTDEKLRLAISSAGLGSYEADLFTGTISTSGNFHSIWGTQEGICKQDLIDKIHPDDLQIRTKAHEEAETTGTMCYEVRINFKKDSWRWIRINGRIYKNNEGLPTTLIGIVQDITEQREAAEELKRQVDNRTADLKRSNEDLMQFANVVSHDLKEPVRKIGMFNAIARDSIANDSKEKAITYLDKVQHSSQRMTSIIDGVLNYSSLNKSGHPIKTVNLNTIISDIKTDLELIIHEKNAVLIVKSIPPIEGSTILIHQLFYNLIHNALKFSLPDNPPRVTITGTEIVIEGVDYVRITIKDNGVGFDSKHAEKIFSPFERLHPKEEFEGTGLGLSLCKKIAERHHGTIEAFAHKGEGAEFVVCLPIHQPSGSI